MAAAAFCEAAEVAAIDFCNFFNTLPTDPNVLPSPAALVKPSIPSSTAA